MGRRCPLDHKAVDFKIVAKNSCQARIVLNDQNASVHISRDARDCQGGCRAHVGGAVQMKSAAVILRNAAHDRETKPTAITLSRAAPSKPLLHTTEILGGNTFAMIRNRELDFTA